jgi:putative mycofactocin binding protein MftB
MSGILYGLAPGVSVRKESFGLLFYNARDTNLTFVRSGDLIDPEYLWEERHKSEFYRWDIRANEKTRKILAQIVDRGLVLEKRISL